MGLLYRSGSRTFSADFPGCQNLLSLATINLRIAVYMLIIPVLIFYGQ